MKNLEQAFKNIGKLYYEANFPEDKYKLIAVFLDDDQDLYFHLQCVLDQNDIIEIHYHDFNSFWHEYKNISDVKFENKLGRSFDENRDFASEIGYFNKFNPSSKNSLTNTLYKRVDEITVIYKRLSLEPGSNLELRSEYLRIKNIIRNMCSECGLLFHDKGFFN